MADLSSGDSKLVQYLNEAYGTEMRLETALQEHITMAARPAYRKRLKQHLTETKRHAREVKAAIAKLGGVAESVSVPGPQPVSDVAGAVVGRAQKAVALAQGPLHALRGTGQDEKQLKNAKTEYASEAEEIATYTAIETLAEALGNRDVRQLARAIRREEERMRGFLEREIGRLAKAVVKAEVPAAERRARTPAKRTAKRPSRKAAAAGRKRSASARASSRAKTAAGGSSSKAASASKAGGAKRKAPSRAGAAKSTARSRAGAAKPTARGRSGAAKPTARRAA
jgi:ferritin-like metal-binding protein YciE